MIGGVTRHMLPYLPGVPHLHVNGPLNDYYLTPGRTRKFIPLQRHKAKRGGGGGGDGIPP